MSLNTSFYIIEEFFNNYCNWTEIVLLQNKV